jgi:undecaprenyl-diphosphatase
MSTVALHANHASHEAIGAHWLERLVRFGYVVRGIIYFVPGVLALRLALAAVVHRVPYFAWDVTVARQVQGLESAWIDPLLWLLNAVGFPPVAGIFYGVVILLIFLLGARIEAAGAGVTALGGSALNHVVKALVERPRPPEALIHVDHHLAGFSFPAGHVLNFTAFAGFLSYVAWVRLAPSWRRTAVIATLLVLIALMGVARIRAGEHWPSDVLGGYWVGFLWLAVTVAIYQWWRASAPADKPAVG